MQPVGYLIDNLSFEEGGCFGVGWGGEEAFCFGDFDDSAVYQQSGAVGEAAGLEDVVGDEDGCGLVSGVFLTDNTFDEADVVGVEVGGGFVEEEDIGANKQGTGQGNSLGFSGGEFAGGLVGKGF